MEPFNINSVVSGNNSDWVYAVDNEKKLDLPIFTGSSGDNSQRNENSVVSTQYDNRYQCGKFVPKRNSSPLNFPIPVMSKTISDSSKFNRSSDHVYNVYSGGHYTSHSVLPSDIVKSVMRQGTTDFHHTLKLDERPFSLNEQNLQFKNSFSKNTNQDSSARYNQLNRVQSNLHTSMLNGYSIQNRNKRIPYLFHNSAYPLETNLNAYNEQLAKINPLPVLSFKKKSGFPNRVNFPGSSDQHNRNEYNNMYYKNPYGGGTHCMPSSNLPLRQKSLPLHPLSWFIQAVLSDDNFCDDVFIDCFIKKLEKQNIDKQETNSFQSDYEMKQEDCIIGNGMGAKNDNKRNLVCSSSGIGSDKKNEAKNDGIKRDLNYLPGKLKNDINNPSLEQINENALKKINFDSTNEQIKNLQSLNSNFKNDCSLNNLKGPSFVLNNDLMNVDPFGALFHCKNKVIFSHACKSMVPRNNIDNKRREKRKADPFCSDETNKNKQLSVDKTNIQPLTSILQKEVTIDPNSIFASVQKNDSQNFIGEKSDERSFYDNLIGNTVNVSTNEYMGKNGEIFDKGEIPRCLENDDFKISRNLLQFLTLAVDNFFNDILNRSIIYAVNEAGLQKKNDISINGDSNGDNNHPPEQKNNTKFSDTIYALNNHLNKEDKKKDATNTYLIDTPISKNDHFSNNDDTTTHDSNYVAQCNIKNQTNDINSSHVFNNNSNAPTATSFTNNHESGSAKVVQSVKRIFLKENHILMAFNRF